MHKIVVVSDTHNQLSQMDIPNGDILIHCGDWTMLGEQPEMIKFGSALRKLPHKYKIVIPGNHDLTTDITHPKSHKDWYKWLKPDKNTTVLINEYTQIAGIHIYATSLINPIGNPWRRWGYEKSEEDQQKRYSLINQPIDIVISHAPPYGLRDEANYGSQALKEMVERVQPKYHFFGHCHDGYGITETETTTYVNASSCTRSYIAKNKPIEVEYE
jgi:Icc-related predicted phosphoesterase